MRKKGKEGMKKEGKEGGRGKKGKKDSRKIEIESCGTHSFYNIFFIS